MRTADQILEAVKQDPLMGVRELARRFRTSTCQVRRVLRRAGIYDALSEAKKPLVEVIHQPGKPVICTEAFLTDIHIPFHDEDALGVVLGYLEELQPDRIWVSELLDFSEISVHAKTREDRHLAEEVDMGRRFLNQLRQAHPAAQLFLEGGNHNDDRYEKYLANLAVGELDVLDLETVLCLDRLDIRYVSAYSDLAMTGRAPRFGELFHLHGHEVGLSWKAVNVARNMWLKLRYNAIFGHYHKTQSYANTDLKGRQTAAWSVGCLCQLTPRYMPINDWNHGFAVVQYHEDGTFVVKNHMIVEGMVV